MKTLILTAVLAVACVSAFAQGAFLFNNFGGGANAPVFDTDGVTKLGNTFQADLYWARGTETDSTLLSALGQPVTFTGSGYFLGGSRTIPGTTAETITAQVRVWDTAHGSSWLQALFTPGAHVGQSALFQIVLTVPPFPPNTRTGLRSFSLLDLCLSCNQPWPVAVVVQSYGPNGLLFSWPNVLNAARYRVQQNPDLDPTNWVTLPDQPVLVGQPPNCGCLEFQVALTKPAGKTFYRLVWQ